MPRLGKSVYALPVEVITWDIQQSFTFASWQKQLKPHPLSAKMHMRHQAVNGCRLREAIHGGIARFVRAGRNVELGLNSGTRRYFACRLVFQQVECDFRLVLLW